MLISTASAAAVVGVLDFDLTVSIVHPMGGGIAASVFWIPLR